jgi:hypothetical protein
MSLFGIGWMVCSASAQDQTALLVSLCFLWHYDFFPISVYASALGRGHKSFFLSLLCPVSLPGAFQQFNTHFE